MSKKRLDLAYGNPAFLQSYYLNNAPLFHYAVDHRDMPYKLGKIIDPKLEQEIKKIHKKHKNCKITSKSQIIVTIGAVQALQAALYAYKKLRWSIFLYVPAPYWGRFEDFAAHENYRLTSQWTHGPIKDQAKDIIHRNEVALITTPNNPDGVLYDDVPASIRDACYNWPQYTEKVVNVNDPVVVFSLSKLSGHSSTRIGWAIVKDPDLAAHMQDYIETFSSGVSIEAQKHAANVLEFLNSNDSFFLDRRLKLKNRINAVRKIIKHGNLPIEIFSKDGMFLYIKCRPQTIHDLHIKCFAGSSFGDKREDLWRLNIGCNDADFIELMVRLKQLSAAHNS